MLPLWSRKEVEQLFKVLIPIDYVRVSEPFEDQNTFWKHSQNFLEVRLQQISLNYIQELLLVFHFKEKWVHTARNNSESHSENDLLKLVAKVMHKVVGGYGGADDLSNQCINPVNA